MLVLWSLKDEYRYTKIRSSYDSSMSCDCLSKYYYVEDCFSHFSPPSTVASLASCSLASLCSPTLWVPSQDLVRGVDIWFVQTQPIPVPASSFVLLSCCLLDCEQSLVFLQLATRVRERRAAKPRNAWNEGFRVSRLQSRAFAFSPFCSTA